MEFHYGRESTLGGSGYEAIQTYRTSDTLASLLFAKFDYARMNDGRSQTRADLLTSAAPPQYQCRPGTSIQSQNPTTHNRSDKFEE